MKKKIELFNPLHFAVLPDGQFNNVAPDISWAHASFTDQWSLIYFLFYIFKEKKFSLYYLMTFFFFLFIVLVLPCGYVFCIILLQFMLLPYYYIFCIILLQFILFYRAMYFSCKINSVPRPFSFYIKYLSTYLLFVFTLSWKRTN